MEGTIPQPIAASELFPVLDGRPVPCTTSALCLGEPGLETIVLQAFGDEAVAMLYATCPERGDPSHLSEPASANAKTKDDPQGVVLEAVQLLIKVIWEQRVVYHVQIIGYRPNSSLIDSHQLFR